MSRSILSFVSAALLILGTAATAPAASPPSGTISCVVTGDDDRPNGNWRVRFSPAISSTPSPGRMKVMTYMRGTCDAAGVVGGKAPITNVQAHLLGKLAAGTTCATLTSSPVFEKLRLKITWQTLGTDGRLRTVAKTSATFVDVEWDDGLGGLVFASAALKGGFAGSTSTLKIAFDAPEAFATVCDTGAIDGSAYGGGGDSTLTIP